MSSIQGIKVQDGTNTAQIVVETSPNDPTTVTLKAGGTITLHPTGDSGPYTVAFKPASQQGVVPKDSKTATVALEKKRQVHGKTTVTVTTAVVSSTGSAAPSEFTIDDAC